MHSGKYYIFLAGLAGSEELFFLDSTGFTKSRLDGKFTHSSLSNPSESGFCNLTAHRRITGNPIPTVNQTVTPQPQILRSSRGLLLTLGVNKCRLQLPARTSRTSGQRAQALTRLSSIKQTTRRLFTFLRPLLTGRSVIPRSLSTHNASRLSRGPLNGTSTSHRESYEQRTSAWITGNLKRRQSSTSLTGEWFCFSMIRKVMENHREHGDSSSRIGFT